jgi:hypothetical protein
MDQYRRSTHHRALCAWMGMEERLVPGLSLQRPPIRECTCMSCHPSGCSSALRNVASGSKPAFEATRHEATLAVECRTSSR